MEQARDRLERHVVSVMERENGPFGPVQGLEEKLAQALVPLPPHGSRVGSLVQGRHVRQQFRVFHGGPPSYRAIDGLVSRNAVKPRRESGLTAVGVEVPVRLEEYVLRQVGCRLAIVGIPEAPPGDPDVVPSEELLEQPRPDGASLPDAFRGQLVVCQVGRLHRTRVYRGVCELFIPWDTRGPAAGTEIPLALHSRICRAPSLCSPNTDTGARTIGPRSPREGAGSERAGRAAAQSVHAGERRGAVRRRAERRTGRGSHRREAWRSEKRRDCPESSWTGLVLRRQLRGRGAGFSGGRDALDAGR